ncbi:TlpA family protein disulfide reductase [Micromonospora sp. NPDC092111]|uniref:TlpA family protein disulfide reductase n=1 Tax=Micromonospora sp. NPDC092111 TaxID=3364289 RepID=UPI0038292BB6
MRHSTTTGLLVLVGVLALATALGWWWQRRDGRIRPTAGAPAGPDTAPPPALAALGVRTGVVTLVQFSSARCAPCRATRRVLADVEARVDGVHLREVDAERHLDAVRELAVWRTPTVLVVDTTGRVVQRATGVPDRDELVAALRPLLVGATR